MVKLKCNGYAATLCLVMTLLVGCSQPRLDTSSDEAFHRSVAEISAALSGTERQQFEGMMAAQVLGTAMLGGSPAEAFAEFDGLEAKALLKALNERAAAVRKQREAKGRK